MLTIWYIADKSQKQSTLDEIASKVGPYYLDTKNVSEDIMNDESYQASFVEIQDYLEKQAMRDKNSAVEYFRDIYELFKNVFIFTTIFVIAIFAFCSNFIDIKIKIITVLLYLILCIANFVYGFSSTSSRICWLFFGLMCFTLLFLI